MKKMKRVTRLISLSLGSILIGMMIFPLSALTCEFTFNHDRIEAQIGTVGEIGIQVEKTHNKCTLNPPLDYQFEWEGIQILGETEWEQTGPQLHEKWFKVSLSSIGEGFLKISKNCSKEGYSEKVLPIKVIEGEENGVWQTALNGEYPYDLQREIAIENVFAKPLVERDVLKVEELKISFPIVPEELRNYEDKVGIYFYIYEEKAVPLLIVSDNFLYRFDHYAS